MYDNIPMDIWGFIFIPRFDKLDISSFYFGELVIIKRCLLIPTVLMSRPSDGRK